MKLKVICKCGESHTVPWFKAIEDLRAKFNWKI